MRTCWRVSAELVQPISGSIVRGRSGTNSNTHSREAALPCCIAVLAGLKMRADIGSPLTLSQAMVGAARFELATPSSQSRDLPSLYSLSSQVVKLPAAEGSGTYSVTL